MEYDIAIYLQIFWSKSKSYMCLVLNCTKLLLFKTFHQFVVNEQMTESDKKWEIKSMTDN